MIVAAVDPAFRNVGIVILDYPDDSVVKHTVLHTKAMDKKTKRQYYVADHDFICAERLYLDIVQLFTENRVQAVVFELPPGGTKSARASRCFGLVMGVLASVIARLQLPYEAVPPRDVKRAVKASATKEDMVKWAKFKYPSVDWDSYNKTELEHLADALAAYEHAKPVGQIFRMEKAQ